MCVKGCTHIQRLAVDQNPPSLDVAFSQIPDDRAEVLLDGILRTASYVMFGLSGDSETKQQPSMSSLRMKSSLIKLVTVAVVASIGAQDGTKDLSSLSAPYKGRKFLLLSILIALVINTMIISCHLPLEYTVCFVNCNGHYGVRKRRADKELSPRVV